ncbi:SDR family oxidoreductase [Ochrovirga pacifica]|uniref:SDR family oxidoreductase n=1 Tax=Ochrovirga pacifica TaxID=1042376 RepID=UPI000255836E|nr:SDR family oxidoreductase [Ochrovirga pacifica]
MKIAVTSANGKLGSSIIKNLIPLVGKENVVGIARTPKKAERLGIEIRKGDYNSREEFNLALKGIDKVVLLSGMDKPENRIQQHRNVIEAAVQNNVQKIVYTSIVGDETGNAFSPIVQSNRKTEEDVKKSGLKYVIGRNGVYIEPDLDYLDTYVKEGEIRNCANNGKCTYTSREELGAAYAKLVLDDQHNQQTYNLVGSAITQTELAQIINQVFGTSLTFKAISFDAYLEERKAALGDFLGTIIAGIYKGIQTGAYDISSDFEKIMGKPHASVTEMMVAYKNK